jgi:hypothetical protein
MDLNPLLQRQASGFNVCDLNSNGISSGKMCTYLEILVINYCSKKYVKENTMLNCGVLF